MIIKDSFDDSTTNYNGSSDVKPYYTENRIAGINHNFIQDVNGNFASRTLSAESINNGSGYIKSVRVPIGSWDMDATQQVEVSIPTVITIDNFYSAEAWIINDAQGSYDPIEGQSSTGGAGGRAQFSASGNAINVIRATGGFYDSASFNDATINRGWVIVKYLV